MEEWWERRGKNLPSFDDVAEVTITGIAKRSRSNFHKYFKPILGRSAKMLPLISAMFVYNEARANGNSPADAAIIAGLEEINPCPIGYSEFYEAGEAYHKAVERKLQINRDRFERIMEIQNGGPVPNNAGGRK